MAEQELYFEIQSFLADVDYPASRDELLAAAQANDATDEVLAALRDLPVREFADPTEVSEAVGA